MGSFNTSCFASNQTIASGDHCMVIPVRQKSGYNEIDLVYDGKQYQQPGLTSSTCYPTAFWRPVGLWVEAKYYDYGRVELLDSQCNRQRVVDYLLYCLHNTASVAQGENQFHDVPYDLPSFLAKETPELAAWLDDKPKSTDATLLWEQSIKAWDYIWGVAAEHRLFGVTNMDGNLRPVQYAVVHRAAYDELVKIGEGRGYFDQTDMTVRAVFDRALSKAKDASRDLSSAKLADSRHRWYFDQMFFEEFRYLGSFEGMSYPGEQNGIRPLMDAHLKGVLSTDALFEELKPWFEARYICSGLEALNLKFAPLVYASQDYSNEIGRDFARFVRSTAAVVSKCRRDRN